MRRTVFVLSTVAVLMFSVVQLAAAQWKANHVTNQTDESLYVIHSTWRPAKDNIPSGFRTRGYYHLLAGETRKFYAWSDNSIYFRILRSDQAIKPNVNEVTFGFWVHPSRAFMIVSDELSAAVKLSDLSYVNRPRDGFVREDGFMKYSNGSVVNITSGWVSVVPDAPVPDAPDAGGVVDLPGAPPEGMVLIPAGTFQMGSNSGRGHEKPVHSVSIDAFYMDTHEVTNAEYTVFLNAKGKHADAGQIWLDIGGFGTRIELVAGAYRSMSEYTNHPVVNVSWYGAMAYAAWAGKRLPTEAEWEYAARGGLAGKKYPWGNTIDSSRANYDDHKKFFETTEVGSYPANGYGLHDMTGNVWEWCLDEYDRGFYASSPAQNPLSGSPDIQTLLDTYTSIKWFGVLRGGSWVETAQNVRLTVRNDAPTTQTNTSSGFRCVRSVSASDAGNGGRTDATPPPPLPSVTNPSQEPPDLSESMVLIPAGEFEMGSNDADSLEHEQPVHTVYVDAFYMDTHEVTNADFQRFVLANPQWQKSRIPRNLHTGYYLSHWDDDNNYPADKANHPVVEVSWYAAVAYAAWAGKRLPTEAEWEYAARGGLAGKKYPWGDTIDISHANYGNEVRGTTPVGHYAPNGYGLYDMAGNVDEWCLDEYDEGFYASSPAQNPLSGSPDIQTLLDNYTSAGLFHVLRGGSWDIAAEGVRVSERYSLPPSYTNGGAGFRCAWSVSP